ncbi:acyl-CoA dehydrogenase [Trinickia symbiotica]|uniref:Acyl-CoA dehydrogenase n=1 Tax=Trinickia symbiotica TaxID=863227 RepID=A0A2N7WM16_9BURK|nr:acyl-CoA dehydrogenase family protein [Trinickia symbiotica]PMS30432.1 acyl-CoA dehydrogenase [Trinickia symbiotica]PPK41220.1 acyl-CoA dehydrogenase [Trinickia symbiotica]
MDFGLSSRGRDWLARVQTFLDEHVYPNEELYEEQLGHECDDPWRVPPIMLELQNKAREAGLWNMHIHDPRHGPSLSNVDYAPIAEALGRVHWASEVFNCNAPDSGNMDLLSLFGSPEQQEKWLKPMLAGEIKSCFAMTEPAVASSDATNVETRIERDGDTYVINGRKWWITNAFNPRMKIMIVMGKSDPNAPRHKQQTQVLVEPNAPGVKIVRPLPIFGYYDRPHGHGEIVFENVRVPAENVILGEGRGFEIAQGRLGPGRIHHAMRIIGVSERLLEKLCTRLSSRVAFGKRLSDEGVWQNRIARARINIEMSRLLVYKTAWLMDTVGVKNARSEISQIKVIVPELAQSLCDVVQQAYGAAGMCDDFGLAYTFARLRVMRIGDGPDEVHNRVIARNELKKYASPKANEVCAHD